MMHSERSASNDLSVSILAESARRALLKLNPLALARNPVMFVVALGATAVTGITLYEFAGGRPSPLHLQISLWLWFSVFAANLAVSLAGGRGRARAQELRGLRFDSISEFFARRLTGIRSDPDGSPADLTSCEEERIRATNLRVGDIVVCEAGDVIPADGEVIEGVASVDESAITGESAPVVRESGRERSAVAGCTRVTSDRIFIRITSIPGETFLDRMISSVEGAADPGSPDSAARRILFMALSGLPGAAALALYLVLRRAGGEISADFADLIILTTLIVSLMPVTGSALLPVIIPAGLAHLLRMNVIARHGKAIEAAGKIDVLLLEKTGAITLGNRTAVQFLPAMDVDEIDLAAAAQLASLADETPEGRSIVVLAKERFGQRPHDIAGYRVVPFSARTRMSGIDIPSPDGKRPARQLRKGSPEAVRNAVLSAGGRFPYEINVYSEDIAREGGTALVVVDGDHVLGVVHLKDVVKGGIRERFLRLRRMGVRSIMITGDNPTTAAAIAAEAGVDDFMALATPETRLARIREEQSAGRSVAMTGDGTSDAPALALADVGVAMNIGTQAAREAGNMVDLDSTPIKLIDIVEIGKRLLMARQVLTLLSAMGCVTGTIIVTPVVIAGLSGESGTLAFFNILRLGSAGSAVLSVAMLNALTILAVILPIFKGMTYAGALSLRRRLLIYGPAAILLTVVGIKGIDLALTVAGFVR